MVIPFLIFAGLVLMQPGNMPQAQYIPGNQEILLRPVNMTGNNITNIDCVNFVTGYSLCDTIVGGSYDITSNETYLNNTIDIRKNYTGEFPYISVNNTLISLNITAIPVSGSVNPGRMVMGYANNKFFIKVT